MSKVYKFKNGFQITTQTVYNGYENVSSWAILDPKGNRIAGTSKWKRAKEIALNGGIKND